MTVANINRVQKNINLHNSLKIKNQKGLFREIPLDKKENTYIITILLINQIKCQKNI